MPWSKPQQKLARYAATLADWNDDQRLNVMRTIGCPLITKGGERRPSVTARGNTQRQYERFMELAETSARMEGRGENFPAPRNYASWYDAMQAQRNREMRMVEAIFDEARANLPEQFNATAMPGFIRRQTTHHAHPIGHPTACLDELTSAQLYQVIEAAKAWIGREFWRRDIEPRSFTIPPHIVAQMEGKRVA